MRVMIKVSRWAHAPITLTRRFERMWHTVPLIFRPITDAARRSRALWFSVIGIEIFALLGFGIPYTVFGFRVAASPATFATITRYGGGIHTYGALLSILGTALLAGVIPLGYNRPPLYEWLLGCLRCAAVFTFVVFLSFAWTWIDTGTPTLGALIIFGILWLLALCGRSFAPDQDTASAA